MNFKELILPISFALLVTLGINYYFNRRVEKPVEEPVSGQMLEVKQHEPEASAPIDWHVDFAEPDDSGARVDAIETAYGKLVFSAAGAALNQLQFKQGSQLLTAIEAKTPDKKTFLVAFSDKTPYKYTLRDRQEDEQQVTLTYEYKMPEALFVKTFVVNKQVPKIDLIIAIQGNNKPESIKKIRVLYTSPTVAALDGSAIMAFVNDPHQPKTIKIYRSLNDVVNKILRKPTIFGVADRFFVNAMVNDCSGFVYRGAFKELGDSTDMLVQLESNEIVGTGQWKLTFYMGPKQLALMKQVDERLEQTLDYGFWSPLAKIIFIILNFLYGYVHNYGLAIVLFTILLQLLLMPLSIKGQRDMEKQAELQRKMQYLKQKYRTDPERLKLEQAEMIKQHGVGGLMGGCFLLFLQTPIFFALQPLLNNCIELHNAHFLWISNLASYDHLYILPVIAFVGVLARSYSKDKPVTQQLTMVGVALLIGAVTTKLPAGLVLFIVTSTLMNFVQVALVKLKR